jgi:hypothetical protein
MNSEKELHIISFDVPYPPNYGGVIDVFYKIKALAEQGVKIHLHTFQYGRPQSAELEKYCYKVYYYQRKIYKDPFFSRLPYIVTTRNSPLLLENLLKDNHPVLFEGIHCCFYLSHPDLKNRKKIVRMHNIEHLYYKNLAKIEKNIFKKYFFLKEAQRLRKFEKQLDKADDVAAISPDDTKLLGLKFKNVFYLPVFHANENVEAQVPKEKFALYHGNLGVGENNEAALFLVNKVFNEINYPLVIAGMNPSKELLKATEGKNNIKLQPKVTTDQIMQLIKRAQINVLVTFQSTGIKLKLINVLFHGGFCIVNDKMVRNTGLEPLCIIANTPQKIKEAIRKYSAVDFDPEKVTEREKLLKNNFDNATNARTLISHL